MTEINQEWGKLCLFGNKWGIYCVDIYTYCGVCVYVCIFTHTNTHVPLKGDLYIFHQAQNARSCNAAYNMWQKNLFLNSFICLLLCPRTLLHRSLCCVNAKRFCCDPCPFPSNFFLLLQIPLSHALKVKMWNVKNLISLLDLCNSNFQQSFSTMDSEKQAVRSYSEVLQMQL